MSPEEIQEIIKFYQWMETPMGLTVILFLIVWSLIWKGISLWEAARNASKPWFIVLLIVNTVGILEILYIFIFSKKKEEKIG